MPTELDRLAERIDRTYRDGFWAGGSIGALLRKFSAAEACGRPIAGAHSAWELALHIDAWHDVFRRRLLGEAPELDDAADWRVPTETSDDAWLATIAAIDAGHRALVTATRAFDPEHLDDVVPGRPFTFREMLAGAPEHDQYHAGQIRMVLKAIRAA